MAKPRAKQSKPRSKKSAPATNPELERAIAADPDADDGYLVYGDWLQAQGDPRGELIAIQRARMEKPKAKALLETETALLGEHVDRFYGALAPATRNRFYVDHARPPFHVEWHLGFWRSARCSSSITVYEAEVDDATRRKGPKVATAVELLPALWRSPSATFLRELSIGRPGAGKTADYRPVIKRLVKEARNMPATLTALFLGDFEKEGGGHIIADTSQVGSLAALYKAFPALTRLRVHGGRIEPGTLALPDLRELEFHTDDGTEKVLAAVANATLPKLERLSITLGISSDITGLEPVLDGRFPALRHLQLAWCDPTREQLELLCTGRTLPKLQTLALVHCSLTDRKAEVIAGHSERFAHLTSIDFDENLFKKGKKGAQTTLASLCKDVRFGTQQSYNSLFEWA